MKVKLAKEKVLKVSRCRQVNRHQLKKIQLCSSRPKPMLNQ